MLSENICTVPKAADFAYNRGARTGVGHSFGGIMHWVKVAAEVWLLSGVVNLIIGVLWTNKASKQALQDSRNYSPSNRRTEFGAAKLSNAPSA